MKTTNTMMKTILSTTLMCLITLALSAQTDSLQSDPLIKELIRMESDSIDSLFEVKIDPSDSIVVVKKDTVRIRVGNRAVEIISGNDNTCIDIERIDDFKSKWEKKNDKETTITWDEEIDLPKKPAKKKHKKFDGHWAGFEFGGNQLWNNLLDNTEAMYPAHLYPEGTPDFLKTSPEKSFEVNINFYEYNFGFCPYIGIVTGLGLNFNDYKFKNRYTITKDANGVIQPVALPEGDFRLSKLSTGYLTAPLMLEFQIPGYNRHQKFFLAGGVIGGVKMGDHTKTVIGKEKSKDKGDHNISPVRWGYTARVGFDDFGIFATYYQTPLFEKDKGPVTHPLTIGVALSF